jgi:hypothetical protein
LRDRLVPPRKTARQQISRCRLFHLPRPSIFLHSSNRGWALAATTRTASSANLGAVIRSAVLALLVLRLLVAVAPAARRPDSGTGAARSAAPPAFSKVVVIVFENKGPRMIFDNPAAPTFNALVRRYATLTHYDAVAHPSLPNYIALVSGSTQGIESNCIRCSIAGRNLADTLQGAGKTWKTYEEGLPAPGFEGRRVGWYAKKVNPFLYFRDVSSDPRRLARIVPFSQLERDVAARRLPDFSLVVPNLCHDMHSCSVQVGDSWLRQQLPPLLKSPQLPKRRHLCPVRRRSRE